MDTDRNTEINNDARLLELFRQGDRDALASLYRIHHPAVFRFALYMTDDEDASAEVVQETFLWLIHHPTAFDPERGSLGSFLSGVARKMLHRRTRHYRRFQPISDAPRADSSSPGTDAESHARELRAAIAELPEAYREAVVLCAIEEKTYEEAAAILDCPVGTVRSRVHRGKMLLAEKFATKGKLTYG